jgi:hypothetical protein
MVEVVPAQRVHEPHQRRRRHGAAGVGGRVGDVALFPVRGQEDQGVAVLDVEGQLLPVSQSVPGGSSSGWRR